ncbi:MAG: hypothetical protein MUE73_06900 [Planctomycetes bacterium]|jgi:hypothetical protein|nr:hypothetical protein [Planctomycetota bacterium]
MTRRKIAGFSAAAMVLLALALARLPCKHNPAPPLPESQGLTRWPLPPDCRRNPSGAPKPLDDELPATFVHEVAPYHCASTRRHWIARVGRLLAKRMRDAEAKARGLRDFRPAGA